MSGLSSRSRKADAAREVLSRRWVGEMEARGCGELVQREPSGEREEAGAGGADACHCHDPAAATERFMLLFTANAAMNESDLSFQKKVADVLILCYTMCSVVVL
jgi:hypothetical protein